MRVLHISALPLWSMENNAGMSCLDATLRGHLRAGFQVTLVLPQYKLFAPTLVRVRSGEASQYEIFVAPCPWFPPLHWLRKCSKRVMRREELPFLLSWILSVGIMLMLTVSLVFAALKLRLRQRRRFDLVYAHNHYAAPAGWLVARLLRVPNVTRLYGTFLAELMRKPLVRLRYPAASAGFLVPHNRLICANDGTRGDFVANRLGVDPKRFRFWQDGVDRAPRELGLTRDTVLENLPSRPRKNSKWILSASRLSYWKRIGRILRAIAVCREQGVDCQLLVAGDGPERQRLIALASELDLGDTVVWLGAVPHEVVRRLTCVVDAFIITNDVTNRCNPLFEAMRAHRPVVSIQDDSTADLLEHDVNALLAGRDDAEELGRHLAALCTDEELAARLVRGQKEREEGVLWDWTARMDVEVRDLVSLVQQPAPSRRPEQKDELPSGVASAQQFPLQEDA